MENTTSRQFRAVPSAEKNAPTNAPQRVGILGIVTRFLLAVLVLAAAAYFGWDMISSRPEPVQRQPRERSFTVATSPAAQGTFSPTIKAFGEIVAGRSIQMRSQVSGEVTTVSPNLMAGGQVEKGELLVAVDSFAYDGALRQANADLADARLQLTSVEEQLNLNRTNLEAARTQLDLAERDLERARTLSNSGSVTSKSLEDRQLLVSQRKQTVAQQESAVRLQEAAIERQKTAIASAQWAQEQAQRAVNNTRITAPFDGVVVSKSVAEGGIVSNNEVIAELYEQGALDASFTLSDAEYGQLVQAGLIGRDVTAIWATGDQHIEVPGEITRVGAEVDATLGGVTVFARLQGNKAAQLRPGTFVQMEIAGIDYENAYRVPETAIYENNLLYLMQDRRMVPVPVTIAARDGDHVIVRGDIPQNVDIITTHLTQAGQGVLVKLQGEEEAAGGFPGSGRDQGAAAGKSPDAPQAAPRRGKRPNENGGAGDPAASQGEGSPQ